MRRSCTPTTTTTIASSPGHFVCPICEDGTLEAEAPGLASCALCGSVFSGAVIQVLEQIVTLPEVQGKHACEECYHPEMRRLPDGARHCPACGSEVLPILASPISKSGEEEGSKNLMPSANKDHHLAST